MLNAKNIFIIFLKHLFDRLCVNLYCLENTTKQRKGAPPCTVMDEVSVQGGWKSCSTLSSQYMQWLDLKKMTLFQIELSKKIIPECLWLGDTFFTHMSVFGTINKEDGTMSIHFNERDIISCVFHLGSITSGSPTSFYSGSSPSKPGEKIHCVAFRHGTLQVFFKNRVLHGVDNWEG